LSRTLCQTRARDRVTEKKERNIQMKQLFR
jgi:hypothetical protein